MLKDSAHKDYRLAPRTNRAWGWLETPLLTILVLAFCYWLKPEDPLFLGGFPWPILAPLLIAVRYGVLHALVSASMLVLAAVLLQRQGLQAYAQLPTSFMVGVFVSSMAVGEFRDIWERRLQRLQMANEYRQYRLDEFTRAYQLLRSSHDRLELRVAGSDVSLRSTLLLLRRRMLEINPDNYRLSAMAEPLLGVLAQYGSFNAAALYAVDDGQLRSDQALAVIGEVNSPTTGDVLIGLCLQRAEVVSVRDSFREAGREQQVSAFQACIPLVDLDGQVIALVAVTSMPFFALNERTFTLQALLAGHMADLLQTAPELLAVEDHAARRFSQQLRRMVADARDHKLPGSLLFLELPEENDRLQAVLLDSQRGLDIQLVLPHNRGGEGLLVLMPLTDAIGSRGYQVRIDRMVAERFSNASSLKDLGVEVRSHELVDQRSVSGLTEFLYGECGLHEQQVAF